MGHINRSYLVTGFDGDRFGAYWVGAACVDKRDRDQRREDIAYRQRGDGVDDGSEGSFGFFFSGFKAQ